MSSISDKLINILQEDLIRERKHMMYYLECSAVVRGLHREEIGEMLLKEAQDELNHVHQFSRLIAQLGGIPAQGIAGYPCNYTNPETILNYAKDMEQEVSNIYSKRLSDLEKMLSSYDDSGTSMPDEDRSYITYVSLFYEDQLQDSQETALDLKLFLKQY